MVIKKSELMDIIQGLKVFSNPKLEYEQYITDAVATADLMFHIAFELNDLTDNLMVDLGCGTGNLTIAAALLGAQKVISVDIDADALAILKENAQNLELTDQIEIIQADLRKDDILENVHEIKAKSGIAGKTVVFSNPPFGVHSKGIDLLFLERALRIADVVYSIHLSNEKNREFLAKKIQALGGIITERSTLYMFLKHSYDFHKKSQKKIATDVYRIVKRAIKEI